MLQQIQRNYNRRLTLATLATTLGRQPAYLGRLFHDEVGVTVHEYVTRARMVHAAAQVRSGVKVEAVALDLGYRSKKNFYHQFKRRFGMTPEAYRQEHHACAASDHDAAGSRSRHARNNRALPSDSVAGGIVRLRMAAGRTRNRARPAVPVQKRMSSPGPGSHIAILVTDDTGCWVGANDFAVSMTGYPADELRGMAVEVLFPHMSNSDTRCRLLVLLPASPSLRANTVLRTKSAGPVPVHLTNAENLLGDRQQMTSALSDVCTGSW